MEAFRTIVVDDDEAFLSILRLDLSAWIAERGGAIVACRSAAEALAELERKGPPVAIVLSDQRMPGMKGSELLRIVSERRPEVITMLLTAHADLDNIAQAVRVGIFSFIPKPCAPEYLRGELEKALKVRRLREENASYLSTMQEELRWGGELQQALLRLDLSSSTRVRFSLSSIPLPLFQCGGDYHDVVIIREGSTFFMVGDVAGHGIRAAFLTFFLRAAIRHGYLAKTEKPSPAGLLEWLNELICKELSTLPDMLITFSVCMLNGHSTTLDYANAGHLPLFLVRDRMSSSYCAKGPVLGFSCEARYEDAHLEVTAGDRIVLRTDGLQDIGRQTAISDEEFGRVLVNAEGATDYNDAVLQSVHSATGNAPFMDDATLLTALIL